MVLHFVFNNRALGNIVNRGTIAFLQSGRKIVNLDSGSFGQHDRMFNAIFKLTNVARPCEIEIDEESVRVVGQLDPATGVRQLIVGTGGSYRMTNRDGWPPNSEAHFDDAFGVLELTLRDGSYDWRFVPEAGKESRADSGSDVCH